jgi:hypothetical protein
MTFDSQIPSKIVHYHKNKIFLRDKPYFQLLLPAEK